MFFLSCIQWDALLDKINIYSGDDELDSIADSLLLQQLKSDSHNKDNRLTATTTTTTTTTTYPWPSTAIEGVGYLLIKKGSYFISDLHTILYKPKIRRVRNKKYNNLMEEFIDVYKNRPDKTNICGI